jgi:hypothetical protein
VQPIHLAAFIEQMQDENAAPTVKQHLAAISMAGYSNAKTTGRYDRRSDDVSVSEVGSGSERWLSTETRRTRNTMSIFYKDSCRRGQQELELWQEDVGLWDCLLSASQ